MKNARSKVARRKAGDRDPERTRERLVAAAQSLFAQRGLHGVSVAEIAERAGVSVGMINHHFGGKVALYRKCLADFAERRLLAVDRHLTPPASRAEMIVRLEVMVTDLLALHLAEPDVVAICLRDLNACDEWGAAVEQRMYAFTPRLAVFFEQARELGMIRKDADPLVIAGILYLSLSGLLQADRHRARVTGATLRDEAYRTETVRQILDVILRGALA